LEAGGVAVPRRLDERTPRIGVAYAGEWAEKPLRFVVDPERLVTMLGVRPNKEEPGFGTA
jgi:3-methyladenine DNA glycosylase Mpg